jgi:hypothetical protein
MKLSLLTGCVSDCQYFLLDGIKTRYSFVERVLCQNSRKNQIIPLDGIRDFRLMIWDLIKSIRRSGRVGRVIVTMSRWTGLRRLVNCHSPESSRRSKNQIIPLDGIETVQACCSSRRIMSVRITKSRWTGFVISECYLMIDTVGKSSNVWLTSVCARPSLTLSRILARVSLRADAIRAEIRFWSSVCSSLLS